ncbi:hypothetical protein [Pseudomonas sp. NPDC089569]|uniref:hypothetical protein n=1 Tax=Pseudomonas sp. NPDC089569 TaxID=3390722 RepID=UPI003CFDCD91
MKTETLQGNLLSFYVAVSLGFDKEPNGRFWAPWDSWDCSIHYKGDCFVPFGTEDHEVYRVLKHLHPEVMRLRISSVAVEDDKWLVSLPGQPGFRVTDLLQGYALAIVASVYGAEVPDHYDCPNFKARIFLPPFNVPYGESNIPTPVNAKTASTCEFEPTPTTTYREALEEAKRMKAAEESQDYVCDGHSWVLARFHDGTSKYLYEGKSTIGLPDLK